MKNIFLILFLILSLFGNDIDKIKIYTENYPPYNMKINGVSQGIAIDILDAMLKQLNSKISINNVKLKPWATGYKIVSKKKNTMLFSTTRTKQREKLFKWVGPISKTKIGITALKSKNIIIKNITDLKKYKIGAIKNDIGEILLLEAGI